MIGTRYKRLDSYLYIVHSNLYVRQKIKKKSTLFLSQDQKKMFFIFEMKDNLEFNQQELLINKLRESFFDSQPDQVYASGKIQSKYTKQKM